MITRRSLLLYILISALVLLYLTTNSLAPDGGSRPSKFPSVHDQPPVRAEAPSHTTQQMSSPEASKRPLRVYITETGAIHDEVVAAFAHAFGSQPNSNVTLFQTRVRYGMTNIISNFTLPHPINRPLKPEMFNESEVPDIVIATTCGLDMRTNLRKEFDHLRNLKKTHVICVFHHADHWNEGKWAAKFKPWLENGLLSFLFLSPHVVNYFGTEGTSNWDPTVRALARENIKTLTPVFPVRLDPLPPQTPTSLPLNLNSKVKPTEPSDIAFALQGNYDSARRDFNAVFSDFASLLEHSNHTKPTSPQPLRPDQRRKRPKGMIQQKKSARQKRDKRNVSLQFLGHGNHPTVPESIQDFVFFNDKLNYRFYYKRLSYTTAILPAFASDGYLDTKASSSIPASLIAGVPIIAPKNLTDAYKYLGRENVYRVKGGQQDVDVMRKIVRMKEEDRVEMKRKVRARCQEIILENVKIVGTWVEEIEKHLDALKSQSKGKKEKSKSEAKRRDQPSLVEAPSGVQVE